MVLRRITCSVESVNIHEKRGLENATLKFYVCNPMLVFTTFSDKGQQNFEMLSHVKQFEPAWQAS